MNGIRSFLKISICKKLKGIVLLCVFIIIGWMVCFFQVFLSLSSYNVEEELRNESMYINIWPCEIYVEYHNEEKSNLKKEVGIRFGDFEISLCEFLR